MSRMWFACVFSTTPKMRERAVEPARRDDRDLALEIDERFEHRLRRPASVARPRPTSSGVAICHLPFAVVAEAAVFSTAG